MRLKDKIVKWLFLEEINRISSLEEKYKESRATAGEQFVYEFLPSGIVECQTVKCMCCNEEFTDYVD